MDTDELSDKTFKAILVEAETFNHDLTLQFGLLSEDCESEKEYIWKSEMLIKEMLKYNAAERDDMFFGNPPPKKDFHAVLKKIAANIKGLNT